VKSPPKIKSPGAPASTPGKPKGRIDCHRRTNCNAADTELLSTWNIPSFDDDGLDIFIGGKGHVNLKQKRSFEAAAVIVLNPKTARAALKVLPAAIAAADRHRRAL
jgi:hypothetical protein